MRSSGSSVPPRARSDTHPSTLHPPPHQPPRWRPTLATPLREQPRALQSSRSVRNLTRSATVRPCPGCNVAAEPPKAHLRPWVLGPWVPALRSAAGQGSTPTPTTLPRTRTPWMHMPPSILGVCRSRHRASGRQPRIDPAQAPKNVTDRRVRFQAAIRGRPRALLPDHHPTVNSRTTEGSMISRGDPVQPPAQANERAGGRQQA